MPAAARKVSTRAEVSRFERASHRYVRAGQNPNLQWRTERKHCGSPRAGNDAPASAAPAIALPPSLKPPDEPDIPGAAAPACWRPAFVCELFRYGLFPLPHSDSLVPIINPEERYCIDLRAGREGGCGEAGGA